MSKCGSKWGYARCIHQVNHDGACEGSGFRWRRGYGHARPMLLHDPSTPPALGENGPPVFGVDRLPEKYRTCPAWPTLGQIEGRRASAYARFIDKAADDPRYVELELRRAAMLSYTGPVSPPGWHGPSAWGEVKSVAEDAWTGNLSIRVEWPGGSFGYFSARDLLGYVFS